MVWRDAYRPWIEDATPEGEAARKHLVEIASVEAHKSSGVLGAELGYRYVDSPIICREPGEGPVHDVEKYIPTTWPGARLPHVWMKPDVSVHDCIKDGYTLLRLGKERADAAGLADAFREIGAPFDTLDVAPGAPRGVYGFDYVLVRPDLHVVWRGNRLPEQPRDVARLVTGHSLHRESIPVTNL
jgi:hypothetical protein